MEAGVGVGGPARFRAQRLLEFLPERRRAIGAEQREPVEPVLRECGSELGAFEHPSELRPELPAAVDTALMAALRRDPAQRPAQMSLFEGMQP